MIKGFKRTFEPHEEWDIYCEQQERSEIRDMIDAKKKESEKKRIREFLIAKYGKATPEMIASVKRKMSDVIIEMCEELNDLPF